MRNVSDKSCVGKQITRFMFTNFFPPEIGASYEVMGENVVHNQKAAHDCIIQCRRDAIFVPDN